jgi:formate-dependent phosphoribosylglycinamide formyltransferase (GAR transformylase)
MQRLLLLMATRTYRAKAFVQAAHRLGGDVVVGTDRRQVLADLAPGTNLTLDLGHPDRALAAIERFAGERPLDAVVGVDDDTTLLAAEACAALRLSGNSVESVRAAQNKYEMRTLLRQAGLLSPDFRLASADEDPANAAAGAPYPCVLKPVFLAASRGVIRADDRAGFITAFQRIHALLARRDVRRRGGHWADHILIESFIPGQEVAVEALLTHGRLTPLALFDKPDPLDGPYFEETIYLTPSRLPAATQAEILRTTEAATRALGVREGPIHAELRVNARGAWIVEVAARSIGGLCSTILEFSADLSLEDVILRHALGLETSAVTRKPQPAGVMMLPIPSAGILQEVHGREAAASVDGVRGIEITIPLGERLVPLPEGDRYLGFIFAGGADLDAVEAALRDAQRHLEFIIAAGKRAA